MINGVSTIGVAPQQSAPTRESRTPAPASSETNETEEAASPQQEQVVSVIQESSETNAEGLTEEEQKQVLELKQRDQEVRAHEQAHKNVAGPYAGAISYDTVTGPDGQQYAIGGSVQIDTSPIPNNPRATIQKLEVVIRAALAPADPSPEDFAVARSAQSGLQQARNELRQQEEAEREEARDSDPTPIQEAIESYKRAEQTNS